MTHRWLCISTRANDEITREKQIWGVAKRFTNTITQVKREDTLIMYTMQQTVDQQDIPSAITGIYEAISEVYEDESTMFITPKTLGNEVFPLRIKVKPVRIFAEPVLFKPLVPDMSFIGNKVRWSAYIRTAMRRIPEEDYQKILNAAN